MDNRRLVGVWLTIISAVSFGAMAILARIAYSAGAAPITLLFIRFTIAAAIMLVILRLQGASLPRGRPLLGLVAMGALGYVGQSLCFFTALTLASAALVGLLLYLYPALVALLGVALLHERLSWVKGTAILLALAGAVLTIGPTGGGRPLGIALGVGAAMIYALYIIAGSRIMRQVPAVPASTVIIASAAMVYGGLAATQGLQLPATLAGWAAIVGIAVISTVVAIGTFLAGVERIGPTNASLISSFEPVVTVALAALVLGEAITPGRIAGGALILGAVVLLTRGELTTAPGTRGSNCPSPPAAR